LHIGTDIGEVLRGGRVLANNSKWISFTTVRNEHWYRDNQVYFLTSRCRDRFPAFTSEAAKRVFWDRFYFYTSKHRFIPWVTSLMDNHYHTLGYLHCGDELGPMMRHLHGSVAKLVNDLLPERRVPFWYDAKHSDYMDGCIRDAEQARRAYHYTLAQSERHGIVRDWRFYPHTRVDVDMEIAIAGAVELRAFLAGLGYPRYERKRKGEQGH
jgi:REP element-mobilizing transposase RayT